jgi:hypothetical protein
VPDVAVSVTWTSAGKEKQRTPAMGTELPIPFEADATSSSRTVVIEFTGEKTDSHTVSIEAGKTTEVKCAL